jgi:hypothetical protein
MELPLPLDAVDSRRNVMLIHQILLDKHEISSSARAIFTIHIVAPANSG